MDNRKNIRHLKKKIDKKEIPVCTILGVDIAAINMEWLKDYVKRNIKNLSGDYITVANVHTTVTAFKDSYYKSVQNGGVMALPDGGPLSAVGRKRGYKEMERTTGPDFMGEIFQISVQNGYKHFFYGSTEETLKKMIKNVKNIYPGIQVAGSYSPPFRKLSDEEDREIIKLINKCNVDFVWVGLGAPKQEIWMAEHQGKVDGVMVGVGAGFDYFAGNIRRAPKWMQKHNLEWLYRLVQDPKRLFIRYLKTNLCFIWNAYICKR